MRLRPGDHHLRSLWRQRVLDDPTAPVEAVYRELLRSIDYLLYLYGRNKDAQQRALKILVDGEPRGQILTLEDEAEDEAA